MFGYILPFQPELKVREWQQYKAMYCGLCQELKREYGFLSRFLLNYDLVLLALMADSLQNVSPTACAKRCVANPVQQRPMADSTSGLALAADALVLTAYYKLLDDVADEKLGKRMLCRAGLPFLAKMRRKAAARQPELDDTLCVQTKAQAAVEQRLTQNPDEAADATAQMTAALFACAAATSEQQKALRRLGLCLGKMIYYLDAAEDYDSDAKNGRYNVFLLRKETKTEALDTARRLCNLCAGEASLCYNLLPWTAHREILDNILFLGLPHSIALIGQKRKKSGNQAL